MTQPLDDDCTCARWGGECDHTLRVQRRIDEERARASAHGLFLRGLTFLAGVVASFVLTGVAMFLGMLLWFYATEGGAGGHGMVTPEFVALLLLVHFLPYWGSASLVAFAVAYVRRRKARP